MKIVATHAGLTVGPDGATHQMIEDLALMRAIPGMVVISPADAIEAAVMDVTDKKLEDMGAGRMGYSTSEVGDLVAERI